MKKLLLAGLFLALIVTLSPLRSSVAEAASVNINTADEAALETLQGIGPSKATAIIDYRTAHGAFAAIEDIQNVKGIGPSTFANIKSSITVSGTTVLDTPIPSAGSSSGSSATETQKTTTTTSGTSAPSAAHARLDAGSDRTAIVGAEETYAAQFYAADGTLQNTATATWSFGDGLTASGLSTSHTFYAQGDYAVVVQGTAKNGETASASFVVSAVPLTLRITSVSAQGIALQNSDTHALDLSNWRLVSGGQVFLIPQNTTILPNKTITFPPQITGFLFAPTAQLLFPSGMLAAAGPSQVSVAPAPTPSPTKPSSSPTSSHSVQTVGQNASSSGVASSSTSTTTAHEAMEPLAPAAQASLAAAGAAVDSETEEAPSTHASSQMGKLVSSPWSWGLVGVLVLSAGAFILL